MRVVGVKSWDVLHGGGGVLLSNCHNLLLIWMLLVHHMHVLLVWLRWHLLLRHWLLLFLLHHSLVWRHITLHLVHAWMHVLLSLHTALVLLVLHVLTHTTLIVVSHLVSRSSVLASSLVLFTKIHLLVGLLIVLDDT